jgi:hypothetical protein
MNPLAQLLEQIQAAFWAYQHAPHLSRERVELWEQYLELRTLYIHQWNNRFKH